MTILVALAFPLILILPFLLRPLFDILKYLVNKHKYSHIPSPHPTFKIPVFARQFSVGGSEEVLRESFNKEKNHYEDLTYQGYSFGGNHLIGVNHPEYIKEILTDQVFFPKNAFYDLVSDFLGDGGLVSSKGEVWKHDRRLLTPAFHFQFLKNLMPMMAVKAIKLVERLRAHQSQPIIAFDEFSQTALELIVESTVGSGVVDTGMLCVLFKEGSQALSNFIACRLLFGDLSRYLPFAAAQKVPETRKKVSKLIQSAIDTKRKQLGLEKGKEESKKESKKEEKEKESWQMEGGDEKSNSSSHSQDRDFLSLMLRSGEMDDQKLFDQTMTFFFAGHDTTASTITWCMYFLAKHPHYQQKLRDELDEGCFDPATLTLENLEAFTFLKMVINETLRMRPPVASLTRQLTEDHKFGETFLPKDTVLSIQYLTVHHDPRFWERPDEFFPERFSKEEEEKARHPYAYIPFSAGPRSCIGRRFAMQEATILLATLISNFDIEAKTEGILNDARGVSKPADFKVSFIPRKR